MPDFNQYSPKTPYIRPEMPKTGLSLLIQPVFDYKNRFPEGVDWDTSGKSTGIDWTKGINNPFRGLGYVPLSPAAATPYNESKKYNDGSQGGFLPGRDNEDLYARNQGWFASVGDGLSRLVLTAGTKLGAGIGYVGGLMGFGNHYDDYEGGFSGWIAGAADNGLKKWFEQAEDETIKNDWFPIYQEAADRNKGFFRRAATDLNFWTEDFTDGAAFMASAFVPGMLLSKLGIGAGLVRTAGLMKNLTYVDEAAALAADGLTGTSESAALLTEGLGATVEAPQIANTIVQGAGSELQQLPRVIKWIDNAKLARNIDVGATTVINTASEAMFEADGVKKQLIANLSEMKNADGTYKYTPDQVRTLAAKGAKDTFVMNAAALSISNLWEANLLFKKLPGASARYGMERGITHGGLWEAAELQKKSLGRRLWASTGEVRKGILAEGIWEENIQLAIQRLNQTPETVDLDFGDKLAGVAKQYAKQTADAFMGQDSEASLNIGLGGLMGGIAGKVLGHNDEKDLKKNLVNLNSQVNAFKSIGNIYQTNEDGTIKVSESGSPLVDVDKLKSYAASLNKVLNLQKLADNFEGRGVNEMAQIYKNEVFARFAKAHFDSGLSALLYDKLSDVKSLSKDDLAILGYDPDSKDASVESRADAYKKKAEKLEKLYNNIQQNTLQMKKDKKGQKFYDITDKLFYLSARADSLAEIQKQSKDKFDAVKADADSYDESYNSETDSVVESYNQLFENVHSAKKVSEELYYDDNARLLYEQREQAEEVVKKEQKKVDDYVTDNKEVLERLKKDARGRYMYEIANKNLLPSAKEMERLQIIQAESALAQNATLSVMSRLADLRFGEKYYDEKYSKVLEQHAREAGVFEDDQTERPTDEPDSDIQLPKKEAPKPVASTDEVEQAYNEVAADGEVTSNKKKIVDHIAAKIAKGEKLTDQEEAVRKTVKDDVEETVREKRKDTSISDLWEEEHELQREKQAIENNPDRTAEDDARIEEINSRLEDLKDDREEKYEESDNEYTVNDSKNIKPQDKERFKEILNEITQNRKRVEKKGNDSYLVDGKEFRKVTEVIGDTIPWEVRDSVQNAVNAGYTIDDLVKAYFSGEINEEFKNGMSDRISEEAYNEVIKSLDKIKAKLKEQGIEIVAKNVFVFDEEQRIAGEIDLLGVDKNGRFKIYEIQARKQETYRSYGKAGRGIKIRELDQKRLSAYRNLFSNQYGELPDEISVMFPFQVKYDKESPKGFIEGAKLKNKIRFEPARLIEIKRKVFEAIRVNSKFDNIDLLRIYANTFLKDEDLKAKVRFLMRNISLSEIKSGLTLSIKKAEQSFIDRYNAQTALMEGKTSEHSLTKYPGFDNMYSLAGNIEMAVKHGDTLIGYMSPAKTLAYKDADGKFKILDEHTSPATYAEVTGNSESTFPEFKKIAQVYSSIQSELVKMLEKSGEEKITLDNKSVQELFDVNLSYGEFDKVPKNETRPTLNELVHNGVKIGKKQVTTVVHMDESDSPFIMMEKTKKTNNTITKYQGIDKWVNENIDAVTKALTDKDGKRITEFAAIVELPDGTYRIIALKKNSNTDVDTTEEFITNLGDKFTTSVRKNVFKNENVMMIPRYNEENVSINLDESKIIGSVYQAEDIDSLSKMGLSTSEMEVSSTKDQADTFLKGVTPEQLKTLKSLGLSSIDELMEDYQNSTWAAMEDYLNNLKECKL